MLHEPAAQSEKDPASEIKKRIGIRMFIAYAVFYLGFVMINTLAPQLMEKQVIFGLNLAVVYGFSLILVAIISGMIYNHMCTKKEDEMEKLEEEKEADQ